MLAREYNLKADVLKVGHHGSNSATPADFPKAGSPKYAVISCGLNNDYGHPHQETLTKLNAAGTKIYRTDLNGIITLKSTGSTISISTEKQVMKVTIDRFEADYAVYEKPDRTIMNIEKGRLPPNIKEGDILIIEGDKISIDSGATSKRKKRIEGSMNDLWK